MEHDPTAINQEAKLSADFARASIMSLRLKKLVKKETHGPDAVPWKLGNIIMYKILCVANASNYHCIVLKLMYAKTWDAKTWDFLQNTYFHEHLYSLNGILPLKPYLETLWHFSLSPLYVMRSSSEMRIVTSSRSPTKPWWGGQTASYQWSWFQWRLSVLITSRNHRSKPVLRGIKTIYATSHRQDDFWSASTAFPAFLDHRKGCRLTKSPQIKQAQKESQQKRSSLRSAMHHVKYHAAEMHFWAACYFSIFF